MAMMFDPADPAAAFVVVVVAAAVPYCLAAVVVALPITTATIIRHLTLLIATCNCQFIGVVCVHSYC